MITRTIGNKLIGMGRKLARKEGKTELAVELSDHSINVRMVDVQSDTYAWDPGLYRYGNVFLSEYANPIKPRVRHNKELENKDMAEMTEGNEDNIDGPVASQEDAEPEVISSNRYVSYMKQELIESLLNPRQQWRIIAYALIGLGIVQAMTLVAALAAAGAF